MSLLAKRMASPVPRALLIVALTALPVAHAETPVAVQNEVNFLLGTVAGSGCQFYRNGTWYDSQKAHAHLREKYKYLVANDLADTTEHVIDRAATKSSLSGTAYQIRCSGGPPVTSQQWLRERLTELRAVQ